MIFNGIKLYIFGFLIMISGCAGMKVVHPNDQNNEQGTKALDLSGGSLKIVDTYTCKIVASNGNRVSAVAKTEEEAKKEALAKCKDQTVISFCQPKNVKCVKN